MGHSVLQRAFGSHQPRHAGAKRSLERTHVLLQQLCASAAHGVSIHPRGGQEGKGRGGQGSKNRGTRPGAEPGTGAGRFICTTTLKPLGLCEATAIISNLQGGN